MVDSKNNLLLLVLADLRQNAILVILGIVILISALYNIYVTHETRELVTKKEYLSQQKDNLMIEWRNLLIEEHTLDEHSRIRSVAGNQLSMSQPTKKNSVLVEIR
ncbi:cell division protein FtsL [uncultured Psychromonas sp.]|uniref:cell division protein FtsL n=1 Tax=uncultured Psychromonas sp. TaxID=173974 RepID=UPI00261C28D9|nr:cell division protein FtsL [uncultured Psychromonas sp.]